MPLAMRPSPASRGGCWPARRSGRSHEVSTRELGEVFECNAVLVGGMPEPRLLSSAPAPMHLTPGDIAVAALVLDSGERAGRGVDRAVPTEWQFHPVRSGSAVIAAMGLGARRRRPAGSPGPAAAARQSARPGGARPGARPARKRGARVRPRPGTRSGALGPALDDRAGSRASAEGDHRCRRRVAAQRIGRQGARFARRLRSRQDRALPHPTCWTWVPESDQRPLEVAGVTIDLFRRAVFRDGNEVHLTPKEYAVLAELAKHPGRVLTHAHLLRTVMGTGAGRTDRLSPRRRSRAAAKARTQSVRAGAHRQRACGRLSAQSELMLAASAGHRTMTIPTRLTSQASVRR